MVGGQTGGLVLDPGESGKPQEGLGYTHEEIIKNIRKKYGKKQPKRKDEVVEHIPEVVEPIPEVVKAPKDDPNVMQFIRNLEQTVNPNILHEIRYRDPQGNIKSVYTKNVPSVVEDIFYPGESHYGELVSIRTSKKIKGRTLRGKYIYDARKEIMATEPLTVRAKEQAIADYKQTGKIPDWFTTQVDRPKELQVVLSEPEYEQIVWRSYIGEITEHQATEEIEHKARHSEQYMREHATYQVDGKELTFEELKKEEPALYLEHHINLGFQPKLDISRWKGEQWEQLDPIGKGLTAFSVSVLKGFADPGFWVATAKGEGSEYLYEKEYQMYKRTSKGDMQGFLVSDVVLSPPMTNIVYPYLGGAAFGYAFKGIGAAGSTATGTTGKVLTHYATKGPWVAGATISGLVGADIGYTAATTKEGWLSTETLGKIGTYGMQFSISIMGYRSAMRTGRAKVEVTHSKITGKPETITAQKYTTIFGRRFHYGSKLTGVKPGFYKPGTPNYTGINQAIPKYIMIPKSNIPTDLAITPSKPPVEGILGVIPKTMNVSGLTGGYKTTVVSKYDLSNLNIPESYDSKTSWASVEKQFSSPKDTRVPWYQEKPWYAPSKQKTLLKPIEELYPSYEDFGKTLQPEKQVSLKPKRILGVDTKPAIDILKWTDTYAKPKVSFLTLTRTQTLTDVWKWTDVYAKPKTAAVTLFSTLTKTQTLASPKIETEPSTMTLTKTQTLALPQIETKPSTMTLTKTQVLTLPQIETEPLTMILPKTQVLTLPQIETKILFGTDVETATKVKKYFAIGLDAAPTTLSGKGYYPLVKDRVYVKGKKTYSEKFVRISDQPLTKHDALSLGASVTDNSAAASFKITPTDKKPKEPKIIVMPWGMLKHMFIKKDDRYIEKTDYRINTQGEIQGISALGWIAERRKQTIPFKVKKQKPVKEQPIDIFTTDFMDVDKQMQKIMRGVINGFQGS